MNRKCEYPAIIIIVKINSKIGCHLKKLPPSLYNRLGTYNNIIISKIPFLSVSLLHLFLQLDKRSVVELLLWGKRRWEIIINQISTTFTLSSPANKVAMIRSLESTNVGH